MLRITCTLTHSAPLRREPVQHMPHTADPSLPKTPGQSQAVGAASPQPAAVKSEALFDGGAELLIDHRGVMYRLRQTSLGKLILTK